MQAGTPIIAELRRRAGDKLSVLTVRQRDADSPYLVLKFLTGRCLPATLDPPGKIAATARPQSSRRRS